jgi:hypothetical protein
MRSLHVLPKVIPEPLAPLAGCVKRFREMPAAANIKELIQSID